MRSLSHTDLNKGADHHPHHLIKKAVALELDGNQRTGIPDANSVHRANGVRDRSAAVGRERMEVVSSSEGLRRGGHDTAIERAANMPGAAGFERRQHFAIPNPVTINFPLRRET